MSNVKYEIDITERLLNNKSLSNFGKIYYASNEELKSIFSNFDFKGKDVLTVVGSGDQTFYFYNSLAKQVDMFDKNKLAFYYFFLRKWIIDFYGTFYIEFENMNNRYFFDLFASVKPSCDLEKSALEYWKKFIEIYSYVCFYDLVYFCAKETMDTNIITDLSIISKIINESNPNLYNINIVDKNDIKNKYDVIYTSNISEYIDDDKDIISYRDNLYDLLNESGVVICTNFSTYGASYNEHKIFDEKFLYRELPNVKISSRDYEESPGYVYTKR